MQHGSRICLLWKEARELAGLYGRWFWGHYRRELRRYPFWLKMSLAGIGWVWCNFFWWVCCMVIARKARAAAGS